jgi:hypothetical protein
MPSRSIHTRSVLARFLARFQTGSTGLSADGEGQRARCLRPSEPALLSVFRFGKHRGERFDAVPED